MDFRVCPSFIAWEGAWVEFFTEPLGLSSVFAAKAGLDPEELLESFLA